METLSIARSFDGTQGVYRHRSDVCQCDMTFAVFLPPQAKDGPVPVLWYLSGLTCTHQNVMDKGEYRRAAAAHGVAIICPDTSPRGDHVPDEKDNWQFGSGAGFYLDATEAPYAANYRMASYIAQELPALIGANFPVDMARQGIFGHSMGGHGAITLALKHPGRYRSVSAFAPIARPGVAGWSRPAFEKYLGTDEAAWRAYDSVLLIEDGHRVPELLVDQGKADGFLDDGLRPWLLEEACRHANIPLTLHMRDGYDHSYFFISTFMADHIAWHAVRLGSS
ncbi:S-formylglutathione hydrolase [Phyllobacterium myrsinacearum]|uniref:S-formylglutathione hydrolase n=1 Tax=Phyllobacterium myrsinacearum TaxID=28101 RepID=A0A2S9JAH7_9HYPH|nr:S-formylglutathione hydrolase [Phyllobacterium myrsinacearum]PRD49697.1 S-formylglutathione hydrolase [Phyllobacterium myrsinacearum]PWV94718.1 S-formylglutathione hydrolase [Phyllobacterium myrsinacearum]RZV07173.1 S-formylglutathione hydrolase [Phyllobacterium myrsinacearum]